ncbi:hypothetical protein AALB16_04890 [Lachnospiraceae bacterium 62-35]
MKTLKRMIVVALGAMMMVGAAFSIYGAEKEKTHYTFTYGEKQYQLGMEAKTAMNSLGEAVSSRDVNNCANGYVNKAYLYGDKDFEIYVEQKDRKEIVTNITLLTDKVATEEGLKPGDVETNVTKVYKDAKKGLGSYTAALGDTKLYIKIKDKKVDYISYLIEETTK